MGTERDRFLAAVRSAVTAGNLAGGAPSLPPRAGVGYQGAGNDPVGRFAAELAAAGGVCRVVANREAAVAAVLELLRQKSARRILLGTGPVIDALDLASRLREMGVVTSDAGADREAWFAADVGVTGVDYLVAETGSIALLTSPRQPRAFSLLPPVHIAVADRGQLLPDLFDLFEQPGVDPANLPACVSLITGPSKTGDIELRLVTGVHGPGEVYVVLIDSTARV
jgi:L-lactate dehydrogenase complex protein LldG